MKIRINALFLSFCLSYFILITQLLILAHHHFGGYGFFDTSHAYSRSLWSMHVSAYFPLSYFLLIVFAFHTLYAVMVYLASQYYKEKYPAQQFHSVFIIFLLGYLAILILNTYFYPRSYFALSFLQLFPAFISFCLIALSIVILGVMFSANIMWYIKKCVTDKLLFICVLLLIIVSVLFAGYHYFTLKKSENNRVGYVNQKPNIIILMYCSMREDLINSTTHIKKFAEHSIWFRNAYTPVSRSDPATYAVLSGLYPVHSGYYFNLNWADPTVRFKNLLPQVLQENGYQTVFLTNINLFRRIDNQLNWGFQLIDSAPHNVFSFILPKLGDFPLVNLFINIRILHTFFPYHYSNAEDEVHYSHDSFVDRLHDVLKYKLQKKPVFLMINDEVMHYPYGVPSKTKNGEEKNLYQFARAYLFLYAMSDNYFSHYMHLLQKSGLLKNAILIVMADHGESFGPLFPKDSPFFSFSRGNHAFSQGTYKVPMIIHFYSADHHIHQPQLIKQNVSILDVAPTLYQILNIPHHSLDGISLLPQLENKSIQNAHRILFRQSGVQFNLLPGQDYRELVKEKLHTYDVNKNGNVHLKIIKIQETKKIIQFGALLGNILLVRVPNHHAIAYIFVNTQTMQYVSAAVAYDKPFVIDTPKAVQALQSIGVTPALAMQLHDALVQYIHSGLSSFAS